VVDLARKLTERGASEVSLGDTIGVGCPNQVRKLVRAVASEMPIERIALHLHDTYGRALANAQAGFEEGVRVFDSSLAGLGGCPYAPGASGNVATEDLVDLFEREGVRTGIDLDTLVDASDWLERDVLARPLPGGACSARDSESGSGRIDRFDRERLKLLLDEDSFVEDSAFANSLAGDLPADGVVIGSGAIDGRPVCVMANDSTVKAGSWGARTVEKILRI
jgi:hypothetical protein